jgi:sugar lactone lactonase YvrE
MPDRIAIDVLVQDRAIIGKSPLWSESEQALYWVDIKQFVESAFAMICRPTALRQ